MTEKFYTTKEVAKLQNITDGRIRAMLKQDKNPHRQKTHFPHAKKCECGQAWLIPDQDIEKR